MTRRSGFLAGAMAVTLAATVVVPSASAASFSDMKGNTHEQAVLALVKAGVINGYPDGTFKPNKTLTRSDVVKLIGKYMVSQGYKVPSDYKTKIRFTDVTLVNSGDELVKYAALMKDYGIIGGSNGRLLAKEDMTREDMAIALVRLINVVEGIDVVTYVAGQSFKPDVTDLYAAKESARPYIAVLDYFDITNPALSKFNPKSTTTRGQFATFLYRIIHQNIVDVVIPQLELTDVQATGAYTFTVTFNQEVDTRYAKFSVKKGTSDIMISNVAFSKDKKSAKLVLPTKLTEGRYTVTVTGVADRAFAKTTAVANERVGSIEFPNDVAVPNSAGNLLKVAYKVVNQYGEDMTWANPNIIATSTAVSGNNITVKPSERIVEITRATAFKQGDKISVTLLDRVTAVYNSKVLTVASKPKVSEVKITGLYNSDARAALNLDATYDDFHLVLVAKDQYGYEVPAQDIANDVVVTISDTSVIDVNRISGLPNFTQLTIDGRKQTVLELKEPRNKKAGKATVSITSKSTGKTERFDVTVATGVRGDTIVFVAPSLFVAGEKVEMPFVVYGSDGKEITSAVTLNGTNGVKVTTNDEKVKASIENNPLTGKAKLVLIDTSNATADRQVLVTGKTSNNKTTSQLVTVKAKAEAKTIAATRGIDTNLLVGSTLTLSRDSVVVNDQYSRGFELSQSNLATAANKKNAGKYMILVETTDDTVALSSNKVISATNAVTVTAKKKGSTKLKLTLQRIDSRGVAKNVDSFSFDMNIKVTEKANIIHYELKNIDVIYDNPAITSTVNYTRELIVYGITSDGHKVVIPASDYTVITGHDDLIYDASTGKLYVRSNKDIVDKSDQAIPVKVIINTERQLVTLDQTVIITKADPYANTIELKSTNGVTFRDEVLHIPGSKSKVNVSSANLKAALKITDQYGEEISKTAVGRVLLTATNLVNSDKDKVMPAVSGNGTNTLTFTGVERGDSFNLTYFVDGRTLTAGVVVGK